jgi:YspA, cpYpsA-related SLOG family
MKRVLVCGGRDYADYNAVLQQVRLLGSQVVVVHGAARGADTLAGMAAKELGLAVEVHPARWAEFGKAAGHIRNQEMLDSGVDLVLAFPGGRGTENMKRIARAAGVQVVEVGNLSTSRQNPAIE